MLQSGSTALHVATYEGHAAVLSILLADTFLDTSIINNVSELGLYVSHVFRQQCSYICFVRPGRLHGAGYCRVLQ